MTRGRGLGVLIVLLALFAAACGDSNEGPAAGGTATEDGFTSDFSGADLYPIVASSELTVGENRFLVGLLDENDAPIADPEVGLTVTFYDLSGEAPQEISETDMDFIWSLKPVQGLWVGYTSFDHPGQWGAEIAVSGGGRDETLRTSFPVRAEGTTPELGRRAPKSDTPTSAEVEDLSEITTDDEPDAGFYETSVAGALRDGKPFVVVFATPKFCTSQVCGPTLDIVKKVSDGFPRLTFIHVEVYTNLDDPSNLQTVPAVEEWGLPTEPWVFVVDGRGKVVAKYEGVVGEKELASVLGGLR